MKEFNKQILNLSQFAAQYFDYNVRSKGNKYGFTEYVLMLTGVVKDIKRIIFMFFPSAYFFTLLVLLKFEPFLQVQLRNMNLGVQSKQYQTTHPPMFQ